MKEKFEEVTYKVKVLPIGLHFQDLLYSLIFIGQTIAWSDYWSDY